MSKVTDYISGTAQIYRSNDTDSHLFDKGVLSVTCPVSGAGGGGGGAPCAAGGGPGAVCCLLGRASRRPAGGRLSPGPPA